MRKFFTLWGVLILINLVLLPGCNNSVKNVENVQTDQKDKSITPSFGIYLIKGENKASALSFSSGGVDGKVVDGEKVDLKGFQLEASPLITDKDVKEYHWKDHKVVFTDEFLKRRNLSDKDKEMIEQTKSGQFKFYGGSKLLNTNDNLGSVILTVNGEKIYASGFSLPAYSSQYPAEITISDYDLTSIVIDNSRKSDDLRKDKRIYDLFKISGKLVE